MKNKKATAQKKG
jgi:hypothetical protein